MSTYAEILERPSMEVEEVPLARLLRAASAERRTLGARFRNGLVDKAVIFGEGVPVDCRSNMVQDTLSRFMIRQGRLTREQETTLLQQATREGMLFGEAAREAGIASAEEIYRFLQQNLAKKLLDLSPGRRVWSSSSTRCRPSIRL